MLHAHQAACAALRAGAEAAAVDAAARSTLAREEPDGEFPHGTGHGLGLEVHEAPRLHRRSEEVLRANMLVTVEPGLYFPGWGGVRIEDDYLVTDGEPRMLVKLGKDRLISVPV